MKSVWPASDIRVHQFIGELLANCRMLAGFSAADLTAFKDSTKYDKIFMCAAAALRVFRGGHAHVVAQIILMQFPTIVPLGKCSLMPEGLPNPCFTKPPSEEDMKELLMSMKGSESIADLGRATIRKAQLKAKKAQVQAKKKSKDWSSVVSTGQLKRIMKRASDGRLCDGMRRMRTRRFSTH